MLRTLTLVLLLCPTLLRAEDLATLRQYIPREANLVFAVDLKGLLGSPVANREGWKNRITEETMVGLLPFPETAEYAVIAEQLQPGTLQSKWELVLISTNKPFALLDIAKVERAEIEAIGETPACFTKRNNVILQLSPTLLGVFSPGHRQEVARWLRTQAGKNTPSPRLAAALEQVKAGNQIAMVFDLEDSLEPGRVRNFLASHKVVQEKKLNVDSLTGVFSSLASVTFNIRVTDASQGTMRMDFGKEVAEFQECLPELVLSAFDMLGADLDDYRKGNLTTGPKYVQLDATLTPLGFRNTIGMVQPHSVAPAKSTSENDPAKDNLRAFRAIQNVANAAHEQAEKSNNIARAMIIYDNAASRLDKLPLTHVDDELQRFAVEVSKALREMASELHSGVLEVQTLEQRIQTNVNVQQVPSQYYLPNPWGIRFWNPMIPTVPQVNVQTNQPEIVAAQAEAITKAVRKRNELWRGLIEKSNAVKKAMTS
ncbi:MAG TPA: hypothetical protein PKA06_10695, partial [Gemmatales bacterium]|nr:hypothetical protein [Gemmatales bacterium]